MTEVLQFKHSQTLSPTKFKYSMKFENIQNMTPIKNVIRIE